MFDLEADRRSLVFTHFEHEESEYEAEYAYAPDEHHDEVLLGVPLVHDDELEQDGEAVDAELGEAVDGGAAELGDGLADEEAEHHEFDAGHRPGECVHAQLNGVEVLTIFEQHPGQRGRSLAAAEHEQHQLLLEFERRDQQHHRDQPRAEHHAHEVQLLEARVRILVLLVDLVGEQDQLELLVDVVAEQTLETHDDHLPAPLLLHEDLLDVVEHGAALLGLLADRVALQTRQPVLHAFVAGQHLMRGGVVAFDAGVEVVEAALLDVGACHADELGCVLVLVNGELCIVELVLVAEFLAVAEPGLDRVQGRGLVRNEVHALLPLLALVGQRAQHHRRNQAQHLQRELAEAPAADRPADRVLEDQREREDAGAAHDDHVALPGLRVLHQQRDADREREVERGHVQPDPDLEHPLVDRARHHADAQRAHPQRHQHAALPPLGVRQETQEEPHQTARLHDDRDGVELLVGQVDRVLHVDHELGVQYRVEHLEEHLLDDEDRRHHPGLRVQLGRLQLRHQQRARDQIDPVLLGQNLLLQLVVLDAHVACN
eukprot:CAMPEP_0116914850 /NCGR_PEP_ID=MMETSP0467-20121206/17572_1 /TAXON_ID=283647 /ORGANISM="Mesodinium pulex, Strain SPMC105" /LENGTH=544 /DNA_ID=CAMNT_0004591389 /DNA_START=275 /DNA_END=1909 /DNA_ORIENTATION=+